MPSALALALAYAPTALFVVAAVIAFAVLGDCIVAIVRIFR